MCFWSLTYLLRDPTLLEQIRQEVSLPVAECGNSPSRLVAELKNCKLLLALYHETMRITLAAGSARRAMRTTSVGDFTISAGTEVVILGREMSRDPDNFGSDVNEFNVRRFLERPELAKHSGFRPFGGGIGLCPGRMLAQAQVLMFVALAVTRFDMEVEDGDEIAPDMKTPSPGVMGPDKGCDVMVKVSRRPEAL